MSAFALVCDPRKVFRRFKQLLPRGWIPLHEQAVLEGTRRAEEDIVRLQRNTPCTGLVPPQAKSLAGTETPTCGESARRSKLSYRRGDETGLL